MLRNGNYKNCTNPSSRIGFTLVELLVVISIIALLLSILMPSLNKARKSAVGLVCATQLKDIGLAFSMYANDNRGKLPTNLLYEVDMSTGQYILTPNGQQIYARWVNKIAPYYKEAKDNYDKNGTQALFTFKMFKCPTQKKYAKEGGRGTYAYNNYFRGEGTGTGWRYLNEIASPGTLPILTDADGRKGAGLPKNVADNSQSYSWGGLFLNPFYPHPRALEEKFMGGKATVGSTGANWDCSGPAPNHGRNCNMLMADFHVEGKDVCTDGKWPWGDHSGTAFHPKRNTRIFK